MAGKQKEYIKLNGYIDLLTAGKKVKAMEDNLVFNPQNYQIESIKANGRPFTYRAFRHICYVKRPVNEIQRLSIYVPEEYYCGKEINGYSLKTAPIFLPNTVGGYMSGYEDEPEINDKGQANTVLKALMHGYVVVSAGVRGRDSMDKDGKYIGAAPAVICDMKAAVRYLRFNEDLIPGDTERIITNGTSAGGALSALTGATGDHPDYEPYLTELGAASTSDCIFAASCYCPITNLEHADMAYEWEFAGLNEYHGWKGTGVLTKEQQLLSQKLAKMFPAYLNNLNLKAPDGGALSLDEEGKGSFRRLVEGFVMASAQKELEKGADLSDLGWLKIEKGYVVSIDFPEYIRYRTRMKAAPAFDDILMRTPENELFGTACIRKQHFTEFSFTYSKNIATKSDDEATNSEIYNTNSETYDINCDADNTYSEATSKLAEQNRIKMMNPLYYIDDAKAVKAKHYRIRHGSVDRDTSLAIPVILHTKLINEGIDSDLAFPWGIAHAGDYDTDALFEWIDKITKG